MYVIQVRRHLGLTCMAWFVQLSIAFHEWPIVYTSLQSILLWTNLLIACKLLCLYANCIAEYDLSPVSSSLNHVYLEKSLCPNGALGPDRSGTQFPISDIQVCMFKGAGVYRIWKHQKLNHWFWLLKMYVVCKLYIEIVILCKVDYWI